jgi:transposase-like protein
VKVAEREQAIDLRRQGYSITHIVETIGVAKSSVSVWVRDIKVEEERLLRINGNRCRSVEEWSRIGAMNAENARLRRIAFQANSAMSQEAVRENLFLIGCMLYWGEGTKDKNVITLCNSDPEIMRTFMRFLRDALEVKDEEITLTVNAYTNNGVSKEEIEAYWLNLTGLKPSSLRKGQFNPPHSASKKVKRNLLYGTARIRVASTEKLHRIYGCIASVCGVDTKFLH